MVWGNLETICEPITETTSICNGSNSIDFIATLQKPSAVGVRSLVIMILLDRVTYYS